MWITIDNRWFNSKVHTDEGYEYVKGWINKYGHKGLVLYCLLREIISSENKFITSMQHILNRLDTNSSKNVKEYKEIIQVLNKMINDEIINICFVLTGEIIDDINKINKSDLMYIRFKEFTLNGDGKGINYTCLFHNDLFKILSTKPKKVDKYALLSQYLFIIRSINSERKCFVLKEDLICEYALIKDAKTVRKYDEILINMELILKDNAGLRVIEKYKMDKNGAFSDVIKYFQNYSNTYARFEHKKELSEDIEKQRKENTSKYLKYHNLETGDRKRKIKQLMNSLPKKIENGRITEEEAIELKKEYEEEYAELDKKIIKNKEEFFHSEDWGRQTENKQINDTTENILECDEDTLILIKSLGYSSYEEYISDMNIQTAI